MSGLITWLATFLFFGGLVLALAAMVLRKVAKARRRHDPSVRPDRWLAVMLLGWAMAVVGFFIFRNLPGTASPSPHRDDGQSGESR